MFNLRLYIQSERHTCASSLSPSLYSRPAPGPLPQFPVSRQSLSHYYGFPLKLLGTLWSYGVFDLGRSRGVPDILVAEKRYVVVLVFSREINCGSYPVCRTLHSVPSPYVQLCL